MSEVSFSKMNFSDNEIKTKLKVDEYVFEIEGKDIYNTYLTYSVGKYESMIYKDGKKVDTIVKHGLCIELNGNDRNGFEAWISFDLKFDIDYFNSLSRVPTDISYLLVGSESFIKKPDEESQEFLDFDLPRNDEYDIYKNFSSLWISKIGDNEFIMKLFVPDLVFTYFSIDLNNIIKDDFSIY